MADMQLSTEKKLVTRNTCTSMWLIHRILHPVTHSFMHSFIHTVKQLPSYPWFSWTSYFYHVLCRPYAEKADFSHRNKIPHVSPHHPPLFSSLHFRPSVSQLWRERTRPQSLIIHYLRGRQAVRKKVGQWNSKCRKRKTDRIKLYTWSK